MSATLAMKAAPGKHEVRTTLRRVLESAPFRSSPRLQRLLTFLVEEVLAGRGDSLVQYRVATEGLGLGEKFDPENNTLVRAHARRLRKALAAYYEGEGAADELLITLPASGYRVGFVRAGAASAPAPAASQVKLPLLVVSRFRGIGLKARWSDLPASFAEELCLRLRRSTHLRLALGEKAARRPDVEFVLEGSIEQRGDQLLVRSRLLDAPGGVIIWSRRHEFPVDRWNPAAFEEEIVDAIAVETGSDFGRIDRYLQRRPAAENGEAASYREALRKFKAFESDWSEASFLEAEEALRRLIATGNHAMPARAMLAMLLLGAHCEYFRAGAPFPAEAPELLTGLDTSGSGEPFATYARVLLHLLRGEYTALTIAVDRLLDDPDFPQGWLAFACLWRLYTRTPDSRVRAFLAAFMKNNPEYPRILHTGPALEHLADGDHAAARREMDLLPLPENWFVRLILLAIDHAAGRTEQARAAREDFRTRFPQFDRCGEELLGRFLHPDFVRVLLTAERAV